MNANAMVQRCFRASYPELYGREQIDRPILPADMRSTREDADETEPFAPMELGHPEARRLLDAPRDLVEHGNAMAVERTHAREMSR